MAGGVSLTARGRKLGAPAVPAPATGVLRLWLLLGAGLASIMTLGVIAVVWDYDRALALGMLAYLLPVALLPLALYARGASFRAVSASTATLSFFLAAFGLFAMLPLCLLHLVAAFTPRPSVAERAMAIRYAGVIVAAAALYAIVVLPIAPQDDSDGVSRVVTPPPARAR